ncbi:hypothetical protein L3Q82_020187, partial [Scortum barcoo]
VKFAGSSGGIVYTREQLITLSEPELLPGDRPVVPQELRRRHRGAVLVKTQREYRSIFCFSETWLHSHIPGQQRNSSVPRTLSCWLWECALYYLQREFMSTIVITVYIPPSADAAVACEVISSTTAKLQTDHPDAFMVITGDFNHGSLDKTLNNFHQYVDCPTRDNKTLDLLYANAMDAYDATAPPQQQALDYQGPEGTSEQEEDGFQGWRQRGAEESAARTQRHAEDMQGQLQEEAGG